MVDVRYWKLYDAFYGEDSELGKSLYKGQEQCIKYEKMGTLISTSILSKVSTFTLFRVLFISFLVSVSIANVCCKCTIRLM